jgi:putative ABC transport system substrate-binding protein
MISVHLANAEQRRVSRVGVILQGGPYYEAVYGLRDGLRELGYEEGKRYALEIHDTKGNLKLAKEAAGNLERDKVDLIYAVTTPAAIAAKAATAKTPMVFSVGVDPVAIGLVQGFANSGARLTGVRFLATKLTARRLEILKDLLPGIHRVVTFYNPNNRNALEAAKEGREEARQLKIQMVERQVATADELQAGLGALKPGEVDAYFFVPDALVTSQAQMIIGTARAKKLPTMFYEQGLVAQGGLASYGVSFHEFGRVSAKYVKRILTGTDPQELAVETVHKLHLVLNLRTAREIGLTIPPEMLARADRVIR